MRVKLVVNGDHRELDLETRRTLSDTLRDDCELDSARKVCEDGTCGSCTVLVEGEPVRSCLMLAVQCDGAGVRTVEGLIDDRAELRRLLVAQGPSANPARIAARRSG
jgi:carbon-monoxide dehydrogenase small subunit